MSAVKRKNKDAEVWRIYGGGGNSGSSSPTKPSSPSTTTSSPSPKLKAIKSKNTEETEHIYTDVMSAVETQSADAYVSSLKEMENKGKSWATIKEIVTQLKSQKALNDLCSDLHAIAAGEGEAPSEGGGYGYTNSRVGVMVIERISPLLDADAFVFHCLKSNHLGYQVCASKEIVADSISRVPREVQDSLRRYYEHHNVGVYSDSGTRCYGLPFYYNGLVVAVLQIVNLASSHDLEGCTVLTSNLTVCSYLNQILTHSSGEKVPRTLLSIMEHYLAQDMEGVMNDAHSLFNSPRVNCFLSYNTERDLVCIHSRDSKGVHVHYDQGIVGWVAVNMKPVRIANVSEDPRFDPAIDEYTSTKTHEVIVSPILSRAGTLIGVLEVINPNSGCSIDMDSSIMGRLCSILSTMLAPTTFTLEKASVLYNKGAIAANEKVTAAESTQIALAESLHLKDTKTNLGKQVNIIKVLPSLMYEGSKLLGSAICNVYLLDSPTSTTYWAISGSMSGSVNICNHTIEEGIAGQVMRTKQTFMENDVGSNSVVRHDIDGLHLHYSNASIFQVESVIKNLLVTPLTDHNNILIGAVSVANKTTGDYTAKDQVLIENFRHVCAAAVSQADCHLALFCQPDDIDNESSAFAFTLSSSDMLRSSIRPLQYITGVDALTMSSSHFNEWLSIDLNKHLCLNIQAVFDTHKPIFVNDYILKKRNSEETMRVSYLAAVLGGSTTADNQSEPEVVILFESFGKVVVDISKVDTYRSQLSFLQSELRLLTTRSGATYELPVKRAMNILEQLLRTYKKENETAELLCECMSVLRSPDIFVNKLRVPRTTSGDTNTWLQQEFTTLSKKKSFKKGSKSLDRCDESSTGGGSEGSMALHGNSFDGTKEGGDLLSPPPVAVAPTIEETAALDVEDSRVRGPTKPLTVTKKPVARGADSKREVITDLSISTVKSTMRRWDMDLFTLSEEELCKVVFDLFSELEILTYFHIDLTIFSNWVKKVAGNYRPNPFHNFLHGVNVAHKSFVIVTTTNAIRSLDRLDLLIVMVAALSHDLDHPGLNNAYCIKSKDPLALLYNDVSVLENHHASTCFRILANADANILQGIASTSFNEIRRGVINAVLCTDMASHFDLITKFKATTTDSMGDGEAVFEPETLMNIIVHAADLSNPVVPWSFSKRWADLVGEEFLNQAALEAKGGLDVTDMMAKTNINDICDREIGFIDFVILPMWKVLFEFLPELNTCVTTCEENRKEWVKLKEKKDVTVIGEGEGSS